MGRDAIIRFYTTEENKEWLEEQAEATDTSISECCHEALAKHIDREQERHQYGRYGVDQQIELVLNEILEEATTQFSEFQTEASTTLERIQRIRTVYVIALWRLVKDDYTAPQRRAALTHAAEHVGLDPTDDPEIGPLLSSGDDDSIESRGERADPTHSHREEGENE